MSLVETKCNPCKECAENAYCASILQDTFKEFKGKSIILQDFERLFKNRCKERTSLNQKIYDIYPFISHDAFIGPMIGSSLLMQARLQKKKKFHVYS